MAIAMKARKKAPIKKEKAEITAATVIGSAPAMTPVKATDISDKRKEIERRSYELFQKRGANHGSDWEDWFQAEQEILPDEE